MLESIVLEHLRERGRLKKSELYQLVHDDPGCDIGYNFVQKAIRKMIKNGYLRVEKGIARTEYVMINE